MQWLKNNITLVLLLVFSLVLYFFRLGSVPVSVYVDEATVGYNAYSILQNGQDEFGQKYPIYFRFFGAYTPGLYVYLILPFIKFFGLSAFSVRILSALSGVASVYFFYKILKIFTSKTFFGTLFYIILPWTVFNSRLGYEVMFAATLFNAGIYFLLRDLTRSSLLGLLLISLSTYAAHTQRYLAPLFLFLYFLLFQKLKKTSFALLILTQIPNLILLFTHSFWVKSVNFSLNSFITQIITFLTPKTLFFSLPDIDLQHQIPGTSAFFWWLIFPLFFGVKRLLRVPIKLRTLLLIWICVSLIPASLSGEFISIQRLLPLLTPLMIVVSLGLSDSWLLNLILFFYSLTLLFRSYFFFFPKQMGLSWNFGYQELSQYISQNSQSKFLIDNTRNPRNYILPLFYLRLPTQLSLKNYYSAPLVPEVYHYQNMTFKNIDWSDISSYDFLVADSLTVSIPQMSEHRLTKIKTFITPNNQVALEIYQIGKIQ